MEQMNTIAAVCTPAGTGGLAVIRLSGPDAFRIASLCWKGCNLEQAASHTAHLGSITDHDGNVIDQCVATVFRAPNSFTGEDTIEFSIHGGGWLQQSVMARLCECGAAPAGRGDFSKRAFLNGKLDLAQAEGIADLIAADSKAAHRLAISQVTGRYSSTLNNLRERLIDFASLLELELDFSEEEVEFADRSRLRELCSETLEITERLARSFRTGKVYKEGVPTVIAGRPNSGKSTLLNALADDDVAIVSDIPGTTRDVIETLVEINGIKFRIHDTAGLRIGSDSIEQEGILRAHRKLATASLVVWLIDPHEAKTGIEQLIEVADTLDPDTKIIIAVNKSDLLTSGELSCFETELLQSLPDSLRERSARLHISARTGNGIDDLRSEMTRQTGSDLPTDTDIIVSNARHYESLKQASVALHRAQEAIVPDSDGAYISADFIAQDVREAIGALSEITGAITPSTLLQTIFSRFCIGK